MFKPAETAATGGIQSQTVTIIKTPDLDATIVATFITAHSVL